MPMAGSIVDRENAEEDALANAMPTASCNICGLAGAFHDFAPILTRALSTEAGPDDLEVLTNIRERIQCAGCGAISRDRCLILALGALLGRPPPLRDWEPSPDLRIFEGTAYRGHPPLLQEKFDYFPPAFDPAALEQARIDGRRAADLQAMPYPDDFFDVVMSSDVLEHVRSHVAALSEIHRTLRPGGVLVLQAPYVHAWSESRVLVHPHGEADVYLYPPQYHAEDTLVYRVYGRDLLTQLAQAGFCVAYAELRCHRHAISRQPIILCRKDDFMDVSGLVGLEGA